MKLSSPTNDANENPSSSFRLAPPFSLRCARSLLFDQISARTCSLPRSSLLRPPPRSTLLSRSRGRHPWESIVPPLAPPSERGGLRDRVTVREPCARRADTEPHSRKPGDVRPSSPRQRFGSCDGRTHICVPSLSPPTQNSYSDCLLCWRGVFHCVKYILGLGDQLHMLLETV